MKCPNCERSVGTLALSCRICHQRLPFWYVVVITLAVLSLTGIILLLESL